MAERILDKKDILIAPSILAADVAHLGSEIKSVLEADLLHVDIMDGHFVPPITFGTNVIGAAKKSFGGLIDAHLMISNPDAALPAYLAQKPDIVTFHLEATSSAKRLIDEIHAAGSFASVALNPATPVCLLEDVLCDVDMILIMSVSPGFGGQTFIEQSLQKIRKVRHLCGLYRANPRLEVDGGIDFTTAPSVVQAGADVLVAGSALFSAENRSEAIENLYAAAKKGLGHLV